MEDSREAEELEERMFGDLPRRCGDALRDDRSEADVSVRGMLLRIFMYGWASDSPSSRKKLRRNVAFLFSCQFGDTSLKIIIAFKAEMSIIFENTTIGHLFVLRLQL